MRKIIKKIKIVCLILFIVLCIPNCIFSIVNDFIAITGTAEKIWDITAIIIFALFVIEFLILTVEIIWYVVDKSKTKKQIKDK